MDLSFVPDFKSSNLFAISLTNHCPIPIIERHITTAHSGFGHKCSSCSLILARIDQKQICAKYSLHIVKKKPRTEALGFEAAFQKNGSEFCYHVQRPLVASMRKSKFTDPRVPRKRMYYGKRPQFLPRDFKNASKILFTLAALPITNTAEPSVTPNHVEPISSAPVSAVSTAITAPVASTGKDQIKSLTGNNHTITTARKSTDPSTTTLQKDLALSSSSS